MQTFDTHMHPDGFTPAKKRRHGIAFALWLGASLALPLSPSLAQQTPTLEQPTQQNIYGQLRAKNHTTLSAEVAARINKIPLREGQSFKKGQALVVMDCQLLKAQLAKLKTVLLAAEKKHTAEKRLLDLNSTGKLEVDLAEIEVMKNQADVDATQVKISKCVLKAPYSGRVVAWKAREYQFSQVGKGIIEILDEKNLEIVFIVPSHQLAWMKPGHKFLFQVEETTMTYPASVARIGARVDPVSRSVTVIGALTGRFSDLLPGMSGSIQISKDTHQ